MDVIPPGSRASDACHGANGFDAQGGTERYQGAKNEQLVHHELRVVTKSQDILRFYRFKKQSEGIDLFFCWHDDFQVLLEMWYLVPTWIHLIHFNPSKFTTSSRSSCNDRWWSQRDQGRDRRARSQSLPRSWQTQENVERCWLFLAVSDFLGTRNIKKRQETKTYKDQQLRLMRRRRPHPNIRSSMKCWFSLVKMGKQRVSTCDEYISTVSC